MGGGFVGEVQNYSFRRLFSDALGAGSGGPTEGLTNLKKVSCYMGRCREPLCLDCGPKSFILSGGVYIYILVYINIY